MTTITAIPYKENSEALFNKIKDLSYACWLDSGKPESHYGRYDIISALPDVRLVTEGSETSIFRSTGDGFGHILASQHKSDPLTLLSQELNKLAQNKPIDNIPFSGGVIGYFGYDLNHHFHNDNSHTNKPKSSLPDMHIGIYHWAIIQDHERQKAFIVNLPECDKSIIPIVKQRLEQKYDPDHQTPPLKVKALTPSLDRDKYLTQIEKINEYILAGDCYQVNFAQCFQGPYHGDPYSAYSQLRKVMASPFSAYLSLNGQTADEKGSSKRAIMSLSPERFLRTRGSSVLTQPIKGTAVRNSLKSKDQQDAIELQESEKNRAENLMIVDLLRNDLGQHCIPGSIEVETLFGLQSFPNVHHLVSDIVGTLKDDANSIDLLRDCFPGGSITGAPKKRAMEIIEELENRSRGVYCGSIGYINHNGDMDTNIAIRTVSCDGESLYCWGGGGIVADSTPHDEYQESLDKINAILKVLAAND
ncbi:MAG: para-aminobenzoate synthetase component 1 [Cellvibrionaceae bacterium]|jgi:para-aminobenzoate synthetase component 1